MLCLILIVPRVKSETLVKHGPYCADLMASCAADTPVRAKASRLESIITNDVLTPEYRLREDSISRGQERTQHLYLTWQLSSTKEISETARDGRQEAYYIINVRNQLNTFSDNIFPCCSLALSTRALQQSYSKCFRVDRKEASPWRYFVIYHMLLHDVVLAQ